MRAPRAFRLDELKGHRSSTLVNLGACALRLNRTLHSIPTRQLFVGDEAANRLIDPADAHAVENLITSKPEKT